MRSGESLTRTGRARTSLKPVNDGILATDPRRICDSKNFIDALPGNA
jgi:hypothetical protein